MGNDKNPRAGLARHLPVCPFWQAKNFICPFRARCRRVGLEVAVTKQLTKTNMKRTSLILAGAVGLFMLALALPVRADDKDKEITITGEGKCAKCALKEAEKCQNVIVVEKEGKKSTYYFVENDVAKKFHKNICSDTKKVTATGTCEKKDGKLQFTAKKIERPTA